MTIYFDGTCAVCKGFVQRIQLSSKGDTFASVDASKGDLQTGITSEEAMYEVHMVDEAGVMHKGADAILKIVEQYPRWRVLAKVGRWPVIKQCVSLVYRIVAANGYRIVWGNK